MKRALLFLILAGFLIGNTFAQATLTGTSYTQNFDGIASGLPTGWVVATGATSTALGTSKTLTVTQVAWNSTSGQFSNSASTTGLTSASAATAQNASTNRALTVRQTGTSGANLDPGASFQFEVNNTSGFGNFTLAFNLMELDPSATTGRTTTWKVDYGVGATPTTFTVATTSPAALTTKLGNGWGSTPVTVNFGTALDNIASPVWIRISALTVTSGSGSRPMTAIDDFTLNYTTLTSPSISVIPSALTNFVQSSSSPTASQSAVVSASNIGTDHLVTSALANYEVSTDNATWASTIDITPTAGAASCTLYVRLNASVQGYYAGNIAVSAGATSVNLAIDGAYPTQYYSGSGSLDQLTSWGTSVGGSGTNPSSFTANGQYFNVLSNGATLGGNLTINGSYSKVIVGDGTSSVNFTIPDPYILAGTVDLKANSTLTIASNATQTFTFGSIDAASTINYAQTTATLALTLPTTAGNVVLTNATKTIVAGTFTILGNLVLDNVTGFNGGASPFTTINLAGNFTMQNGANFDATATPGYANRLTLNTNGTSVQTLTGNGQDFLLFRIANTNTAGVVLSDAGGSSNIMLGNPSGGGLTMTAGTISLNSNTFSTYGLGKPTLLGTGTITCTPSSNIVLACGTSATLGFGTLLLTPGASTLNNLTVNLSSTYGAGAKVVLGSSVTVNGTLTLTSGKLGIAAQTLTLGAAATISGGPIYATTGVISKLLADNQSLPYTFTFPAGDTTSLGVVESAPVAVTVNSGTLASAKINVSFANVKFASNASTTDFINRSWTVSASGITNPSYNVTANYLTTDVAGTEANLYGGVYSTNWYLLGAVNTTAHSLTGTNLTTLGTFSAGELNAVSTNTTINVTFLPEGYSANYATNAAFPGEKFVLHVAAITEPWADVVDPKIMSLDVANLIGTATFNNLASGTYYLYVVHHNSITTWSKDGGEAITAGTPLNYDFTSAQTQAFGSNLILKHGKYCIFSGDVDSSGFIDNNDLRLIDNDAFVYAAGTYTTDLDGSNFVDNNDLLICDNNAFNYVAVKKPAVGTKKAIARPKAVRPMMIQEKKVND